MSETIDAVTSPSKPSQPSSNGLLGRARALIKHKEFERFWKFLVVGTVGAVIDFGTFRGLDALNWFETADIRLPLGLSLSEAGITGGIAFIMAVISNFIWNRYWTYPDSRTKPIASQFVTFAAVNAAGLLIRVPILELLSTPLGNLGHGILPQLDEQMMIGLGRSAAWAIAVIIVLFWNFFVNRYWTYSDVE
ncbi:MAG: GtrA family protein [Anaerolineae bacterium]|nr:GtrA family protein [Anaerolineae bacterium]